MSRKLLEACRSHPQSRIMAEPVLLVIRDGWGINPEGKEGREKNGDATLLADTPFHDLLLRDYPHSTLSASGNDVGLPEGQMGNSEVGHLNLGAGRIVYQDLTRINKAIADGELPHNKALQAAFQQARSGRLHFVGLVSDGGVHSHLAHLIALANAAKAAGVEKIFVHAITDGRDASPTGGERYLTTCSEQLARHGRARSSPSSAAISRWTGIVVGSEQSWPGTQSCLVAAKSAQTPQRQRSRGIMRRARRTSSCLR